MESSISTLLKGVPLAVLIVSGCPLLTMNLVEARKKLSVLKSPTRPNLLIYLFIIYLFIYNFYLMLVH